MPVINPVPSVPSGGDGDGPCGWIIDPAASGCCDGWSGYSDAQKAAATTLAASWMWAATGRRFGQCETVVQVCQSPPPIPTYRAYPVNGLGAPGWAPYLQDGTWWNGPLGGRACCASRCELILPGHVHGTDAVTEVSVGGVVLEPGDYQIFDYMRLVRTDGQCWPTCCNSATSDNAVTVTYFYGWPVPADVAYAAGILACEFAAACAGEECRLPSHVSSMTQMGTTVDFSGLPGPGTPVMAIGITEIDEIVKVHNPWGNARPTRLVNPNRPSVRRPM